MFSAPKLKRLMEDESLRELVCSKLNLGLEVKLSEDEYVKEVVRGRGEYYFFMSSLLLSAIDKRPVQSICENP